MAERTCTMPDCTRPHRARGMCSTHYNRVQYTPESRHPARPVPCTVCGTVVARRVKSDRHHVCSPECRSALTGGDGSTYDWARDAMDRARRAGSSVVERVEREAVLDRDGWTCQICGVPLDPEASPFRPDAPTVDHIIPLASHGEHTMQNVQAACLRCNSTKKDRVEVAVK